MNRLQNTLINIPIFISIWSIWLCFYHGEFLFSQLEWGSLIGTGLLSLGFTGLICNQLSRNFSTRPVKAYLMSLPLLLLPLAMSFMTNSYQSALMLCVPAALFIFNLFGTDNKTPLVLRVGAACAYSLIYVLFVHSAMYSHPYFDAWQVNSYAQSYLSDFNHIDYVRQNYMDSHYGVGFPYLFTLLVFIAIQLTKWGILAYLLVNFGALLIATLIIKRIFRQVGAEQLWPFASIIITLLQYSSLELQRGGSTVLIYPIILAIFSILLSSRESWASILKARRAACIGVLLGMGLMIRFDFVPFAGSALFLYILYAVLKKQYRTAGVILLAFCLVIAPWMIYSIVHFDHIFITDNSRRLINIPDTRPSSYFSPEMTPSTLFSHPADWASNMILQVKLMLHELYRYIKSLYFIPFLFIVGLVVFIKQGKSFFSDPVNRAIALIYFSSCCVVLLLICVHYFDNQRYYIPSLSFFVLSIFLMMRNLRSSYYFLASLIALSLTAYSFYKAGVLSKQFVKQVLSPQKTFTANLHDNMSLNEREIAVLQELAKSGDKVRLSAALSTNFDCAKFAALSGFTFFLAPTNLESNRQLMFYLTEFRLNYYYNDELPDFLNEAINNQVLTPQEVDGLFRVNFDRINHSYPDLQGNLQ